MTTLTSLPNTPLEAARWWLEKGLSVFPLIPLSKAPAISGGFLSATRDQSVVEKWWTKKPSMGVGVPVPDGIIVTDFDALAHEHLSDTVDMSLPETFYTCTPGKGGGRHFWWRLPIGVVIEPSVAVMPGMDIRTKGSYVVVPPSQHPDGGFYAWGDAEWMEKFDLNSLPLCPAWVIEACMNKGHTPEGQKEKVSLVKMLQGIEPGARYVGLFRAACSMRARGFDKDEAEIILEGIARNSEGQGYKKQPNIKRLLSNVWKRYEGGRKEEYGHMYTLDELMRADLGEPDWFVDDLLAPGLALVYADEKVGKSMFAANLALSIATRQKAWNHFVVPKARGVLYLDLEQDPMFGRKRWRTILDGRDAPQNLRVQFSWPRMGDGGVEEIQRKLNLHPDIEVVVIDIFSLFKPTAPPPGLNAYDMDNHMLDEIKQKIAHQYKVLVIVVHHTNKEGSASGSRAMVGSPDYIFEMSREQGSSLAQVKVKGKNIGAPKINFQVDMTRMKWEVLSVE